MIDGDIWRYGYMEISLSTAIGLRVVWDWRLNNIGGNDGLLIFFFFFNSINANTVLAPTKTLEEG